MLKTKILMETNDTLPHIKGKTPHPTLQKTKRKQREKIVQTAFKRYYVDMMTESQQYNPNSLSGCPAQMHSHAKPQVSATLCQQQCTHHHTSTHKLLIPSTDAQPCKATSQCHALPTAMHTSSHKYSQPVDAQTRFTAMQSHKSVPRFANSNAHIITQVLTSC